MKVKGTDALFAACATASDDAEDYLNRGLVYYSKGEYDCAIVDYTEALRLNPNYAEAYNNRGVAYAGKGYLDKAIADLTQALQIDPNRADVRQRLEWLRGRGY
jgi:tetratricopeptide (TPR) repeat protein